MAEQVFEQIPHRSLREATLAAIRQAILGGDLPPGQRLVESAIAKQLGISRAPVREALRQLETEGLVVSEPHRGTFIAELSAADLWEIYTLRAALEGLAVRLVTEQASSETAAHLQKAVDDMARAAGKGELEHLAVLDMAFHETVCRASGHSRLLGIWRRMTAQVLTVIDLRDTLYLTAEEVVRWHAQVVEHIKNGRADEAAQTLACYVLKVGERICQEQA
jgi:DNA-binding GntR family transcriptional regulator